MNFEMATGTILASRVMIKNPAHAFSYDAEGARQRELARKAV